MKKSKTTCTRLSCRNAHKHPLVWVGAAIVSIAALVWGTNAHRTYAGITINTNVSSLQAQKNLGKTQQALGKSFERLSSGLRINKAADDAAGLGVSEERKERIGAIERAQQSIVSKINILQQTNVVIVAANQAISNALVLASLPSKRTDVKSRKSMGTTVIKEMGAARSKIIQARKSTMQTPIKDEGADKAFRTMNKAMADAANSAAIFFGLGPRGKTLSADGLKKDMTAALQAFNKAEQDIVAAALAVNEDAETEIQQAEEWIRENEEEEEMETDGGTTVEEDEGDGSVEEDASGETKEEKE